MFCPRVVVSLAALVVVAAGTRVLDRQDLRAAEGSLGGQGLVVPSKDIVAGSLLLPLACSAFRGGMPPAHKGSAAPPVGQPSAGARVWIADHGPRSQVALAMAPVKECGMHLFPETLLGQDEYSEVWRGRVVTQEADTDVAMKFVPLQRITEDRITRESMIMTELAGQHVVEYYGWVRIGETGYALLMEVGEGDLFKTVVSKSFEEVGLPTRVHLFKQLLEGLQDMHRKGFAHRDVRPESLIVFGSGASLDLKVANFVHSCRSGGDDTTCLALTACEPRSMMYAAPEVLGKSARDKGWGPKSDTWAAGLILYRLLFQGHMPRLYSEAKAKKEFPQFCAEWSTFDIRKDAEFQLARQLADKEQDRWLGQVLDMMEKMLDPRPAPRYDATKALAALEGIEKLDPGLSRAAEVQTLLVDATRRAATPWGRWWR